MHTDDNSIETDSRERLSTAPPTLPERLPRVGELVQLRSRRWLVEEVVTNGAASPLVCLACADDDAQGQSLEVYWDYEIDRRILEEEGWADLAARGFDSPRQFAAFLHTLRWNCVTATDPNLFQSPFRAGIKIDAYQMEPLRKALRLPRVNLFIADDTGLGKTIEAGLIARELLLRRKAKTISSVGSPTASGEKIGRALRAHEFTTTLAPLNPKALPALSTPSRLLPTKRPSLSPRRTSPKRR